MITRMASIFKHRGNKFYYANFRDYSGKKVHRSTKTCDPAEAMRIAVEMERGPREKRMQMKPVSAPAVGCVYAVIPSHPKYEASDTGLIRKIGRSNPRKTFKRRSGHIQIQINGVNRSVHHLVMESHGKPKPGIGFECRHLNSNPGDNRICNLVWGTGKENKRDYRELHGRHSGGGEVITPDATAKLIHAELKKSSKRGDPGKIAKKFGVKRHVVYGIKYGTSFHDVLK